MVAAGLGFVSRRKSTTRSRKREMRRVSSADRALCLNAKRLQKPTVILSSRRTSDLCLSNHKTQFSAGFAHYSQHNIEEGFQRFFAGSE